MEQVSNFFKGGNSAGQGAFALYLLARGDINPIIAAIPGISSLKYLLLTLFKSEETQKMHYLSWALTTPIMLWLIFLLNKTPFMTMVLLLVLDEIMILIGYLAAVEKDDDKMMELFILSCLAFLPIVYYLTQLNQGLLLVILTLITWTAYPIVWYLDKRDLITIPIRDICYSTLDFTSKVGIVVLYLLEIGRLKF